MNAIESLSERIVEYNERIEILAQQSYPQVALKQIKGVGTLIALTFRPKERSPEKAGVGGSTPSLATMFSITCKLLSWSLGHNWSQFN